MPYIKVNPDQLNTYADTIEEIRKRLAAVRRDFTDVNSWLDIDIKSKMNIRSRANEVKNQLTTEATSLTNMAQYLEYARRVYLKIDGQEAPAQETTNLQKWGTVLKHAGATTQIAGGVVGLAGFLKELFEKGNDAKKITYTLQDGKMLLKGYTQASKLTHTYNYSTWIKKGFNDGAKLKALDYIGIGLTAAGTAIQTADNIKNVWNDDTKTKEEKICDTVANGYCALASTAVHVGGTIVGNAVGGAVSAACCAIPVVGPVIGVVAGAATSTVIGAAFGIVADTIASPEVINQVSDSIQNVVGAAKSGVQAVSDAAKKVSEAQGLDKVGAAAQVAATAVVETAKVVHTAVVETAKTAIKVVTETVKNVGNAVKNFFKGW